MIDENIRLSDVIRYREGNRLEAKKARDQLPHSIWETYSSFANTEGGLILLGVDERPDGTLVPFELGNPEKLIRDFWNTVNNPEKVSANILVDANIAIIEDVGMRVVAIEVPRGDRHQKPVYIAPDPFKGSEDKSNLVKSQEQNGGK
jgi:predicted HTH transcriptional regulator